MSTEYKITDSYGNIFYFNVDISGNITKLYTSNNPNVDLLYSGVTSNGYNTVNTYMNGVLNNLGLGIISYPNPPNLTSGPYILSNGALDPSGNIISDTTVYNIALTITLVYPICFYKNTYINTPSGFKMVEDLQKDDEILLYNNKTTKIKDVIISHSQQKLYCLPKDSLEENVPFTDLYLSQGHAYKYKNKWHHMHHSNIAYEIYRQEDDDIITWYHIELDDWFTQTINAHDVEVESFYDIYNKKKLEWECTQEECIYSKKKKFNYTKLFDIISAVKKSYHIENELY